MKLTPRYYQQDAVDGCWDYLASGRGRAPLLVEPTGSGKALIISMLAQQANEFDPSVRILIITDSRELVKQNYLEFIGLWPDAPAGIYSAGLNRRDMHSRIIFGGIQSIYRRGYEIQRCDILIIDESHMIPFASDAMYQQFIGDLRAINPNLVIIGMTATPFRGNGIPLYGEDDCLFDGVAHETTVTELIAEGYLCAPRTWRRGAGQGLIDSKGIGSRAGEFITQQVEDRALDPETIRAQVDQICEAGESRSAWKIFGVSTAHCEALHEAFAARGLVGDVLFGHTDTERGKGSRDQIIRQFDSGELRYLISNMTLTKGFNVKRIDLVVLCYLTKSVVKYVQTIGRGTRPLYAAGMALDTAEERLAAIAAGPKPCCLVLDFGNNITRCGPFDDPFLKDNRGAGGDAPFKTCPECECTCATATRHCPECGFEYPPPEPKISIVPDAKSIMSTDIVEPEWLAVNEASYAVHTKLGSPDSMKMTYRVGLSVQREWICFSHTGYARAKAEGWWLRRAPAPVPRTTAEALTRTHEIAVPSHVQVRRVGKYDEITAFKFENPRPAGSQAA